MNYPYFGSGVIAVSDIDNGFFLLRPNFTQIEATSFCAGEMGHLSLEMIEGFVGPFDIQILGLPEGTTINWLWLDDRHVNGEISNWPLVDSTYQLTLQVDGVHHRSMSPFQWSTTAPPLLFVDADHDGYGSGEPVAQCLQWGYAAQGGDCDDSDASIYPNAPGTFDDVDNNCNALLDPDEVSFCADITNDGWVTIADILLFGELYGCAGTCVADYDLDGSVSVADLMVLLADFGDPCQD